ncbi:hypothetical protein pb186bvf_018011 [Paramecium bursaria]
MQQNNLYDYVSKVVQVGDEGINITIRCWENIMCFSQKPQLGVNLHKHLSILITKLLKQLWDTAGQISQLAETRSLYKSAAATLLVYKKKVLTTFLVGQKIQDSQEFDLEDDREVTHNEAQTFATNHLQLILKKVNEGVIIPNGENTGVKFGNIQKEEKDLELK